MSSAAANQPAAAEADNNINNNNNNNNNNNAHQQQPSAVSSDIVGTTCMELALEGERLCQTGDLKSGVRFFEEAIRVGSSDARTLSAIYSQLGNAYFYLEDYHKALEHHKQDVNLVHSLGDEAAEAKACGNLGNTYKMLGKFDEAAVYCRRYLQISCKLEDKVGEGRALYNLGNVYHMQGKRMIGTTEQESGELPKDIKSSLQRAIDYYEENLKVVTQLNDQVSMGRAYGNLGNTHYLLGNFQLSVENHKKRLELAKQVHDKSAERRAHLNLGNANVFLGNFPEAIENYSATLKLAQQLDDKHTEAHSCNSLANTYTFLRDYNSAISYHLKYLDIIRALDDKLGEGRACWSLVNIYQMVNDPESALVYAEKHRDIAQQLGDETGLASAKANIEELTEVIAQKQATEYVQTNSSRGLRANMDKSSHHQHPMHRKLVSDSFANLTPDKRQEQEQRRFKKHISSNLAADIDGVAARRKGRLVKSSSSERLFDMIAHFQSGRIDDQRCEILKQPSGGSGENSKDQNETLSSSQLSQATVIRGGVLEDKENVSMSEASSQSNNQSAANASRPSQTSIANQMNAAVSTAASAIKATYRKASLVAYPTSSMQSFQSQRRPTVSAEHREQLFDLIAGAQGQRMDEQRASLPALQLANGVLKNPRNQGSLNRGFTVDQPAPCARAGPRASLKPETIPENSTPSAGASKVKERSHSIAPDRLSDLLTTRAPSSAESENQIRSSASRPKLTKLSKHSKTIDADANVHDEKFLDNLMKYQSTRFNDQRSEFPKKCPNDAGNKNQADNFLNLIVRFQSDRIDDQRSAPPQSRSKDV